MARNKDEYVRFVNEVEGVEKVKAAGEAYDIVGKAAEAADPKAAALLDELERMTKLDRAVNSIAGLTAKLQETGDALFLAQRRAKELEEEFNNTLTPTKKLETDLAKARAEVGRLTDAQGRQNAELQRAQNTVRAAGISLDKLAQSQGLVRTQTNQAIASVRDYGKELTATGEKAKASEGIFSRLRGVIAGIFAGLSIRSAVEAVKGIALLGDQAEKTRNQFAQLYGSMAAGKAVLAELNTFAGRNGLALDATRDAAAKLKNFGLDPLNGSLQSLVDQNAAAGGSMDDLNGKILAVGQAWAKQKLQGEEILQLVERGVPVWEALTRATGKNVGELQKLSEAGKLGRKEISALLAEIGKMNTGAAARNAGTLSGQFEQLTGRVRDFFTTVANSGTLDYFKNQLASLNQYIADLAASGRLAELSKSISDGIVGTGQALASAVGFVRDYGEQILTLARAYAVFKGASFLAGFARSTIDNFDKMSKSTAGATGAIGKFKAAASNISAGVQFAAISVAVDFTVGRIEKLVAVTQEYFEVQRQLKTLESELRDQKIALAQKANTLAQMYKGAGDIQIATAEELRKKTKTQLDEYVIGLQKASKELGALRIQAQDSGDKTAVQALTKQLQDLVVAGMEAQKALDSATKSIGSSAGDVARKAAADLEAALATGKSAASALAGLFDKVDVGTPKGVKDVVETLLVVGPRARDARAAIEGELIGALQKLSGEELRTFQLRAEKAFQAAGGGARELAIVMTSALAVAMTRLGVDAGKMGFAFTESGRDMIATFKAVTENAQATSQQITAAFNAALAKATTKQEAEALGAAIKAAGETGKVGIDQAKDAATALALRLREIAVEVDPLADQFERFGVTSKAELDATRDAAERFYLAVVDGARKGKYAQDDVRAAFQAYAEAVRAAVANGTAEAKRQAEAQIAARAAALGVSDALGAVGAAGKQAGADVATGAERAAAALDDVADAAEGAADSAGKMGSSADSAADGVKKLADASKEASGFALDMSAQFANAAASVNGLDQATFALATSQQRQFEETLEALKQQNAAYDPLQQKIQQLRGQFTLLGDAQLEQLAREQELLDRNRKARQDQADQQRRQLEESRGNSNTSSDDGSSSGSTQRGGIARVEVIVKAEGGGSSNYNDPAVQRAIARAVIEQIKRDRSLY